MGASSLVVPTATSSAFALVHGRDRVGGVPRAPAVRRQLMAQCAGLLSHTGIADGGVAIRSRAAGTPTPEHRRFPKNGSAAAAVAAAIRRPAARTTDGSTAGRGAINLIDTGVERNTR